MLDEDFLKILACPACKTEVVREGDRLVCVRCGLRYPIRDDIPVMLEEEAEKGSPPKREGAGGGASVGSGGA